MGDRPFARLPDAVTLDRSEVAVVLSALDVAYDNTEEDSPARRDVTKAIRLITRKLWPELGELLDEGGDE